jgi:hypothetical protein
MKYNSYMGDEENEAETDKMSKEDKKMYGDYDMKMRAEHDVSVMAEAGEIKKDVKRMAMMGHCAKMQVEYIKKAVD